MNTWINKNWLKILAIILVVGAIPFKDAPFAYFQIMNWVVMGAGIVSAWQAYKKGSAPIMWLFIIIAVIFNPIAPLYFRADVWHIADLITAVIFLLSLFILKDKKTE
jgi:FtsH-binding integral membrane protein